MATSEAVSRIIPRVGIDNASTVPPSQAKLRKGELPEVCSHSRQCNVRRHRNHVRDDGANPAGDNCCGGELTGLELYCDRDLVLNGTRLAIIGCCSSLISLAAEMCRRSFLSARLRLPSAFLAPTLARSVCLGALSVSTHEHMRRRRSTRAAKSAVYLLVAGRRALSLSDPTCTLAKTET